MLDDKVGLASGHWDDGEKRMERLRREFGTKVEKENLGAMGI